MERLEAHIRQIMLWVLKSNKNDRETAKKISSVYE